MKLLRYISTLSNDLKRVEINKTYVLGPYFLGLFIYVEWFGSDRVYWVAWQWVAPTRWLVLTWLRTSLQSNSLSEICSNILYTSMHLLWVLLEEYICIIVKSGLSKICNRQIWGLWALWLHLFEIVCGHWLYLALSHLWISPWTSPKSCRLAHYNMLRHNFNIWNHRHPIPLRRNEVLPLGMISIHVSSGHSHFL